MTWIGNKNFKKLFDVNYINADVEIINYWLYCSILKINQVGQFGLTSSPTGYKLIEHDIVRSQFLWL